MNKKFKQKEANTSCKNSIDLRNSERGNPPGKSIQNRPKMLRWRCLGDAWGLPGASLGPPRDRSGPISGGNRKFMKKWEASARLPGRPESFPGTEKSTKNRLFASKRRSKRGFFADICAQSRFQRFLHDFGSNFHEKMLNIWWKVWCISSHHRLIFWTWWPSRNIVFYDTKATFPFFEFVYFFLKYHRKVETTLQRPIFVSKNFNNGPWGPILAPKTVSNSCRRDQTSQKCFKKVVFWPCYFLNIF